MRARLITELDPSVFKGLIEGNEEICTIEATVPTGMEDVCVEEAKEKLGAVGVATAGRAFFDVPLQDVSKVLNMRSVENVHVVIHMQSNFPLTNDRNACFTALYGLAADPLWRKGLGAWQKVFGDLPTNTFDTDRPLTVKFQEPKPLLDLCLMKKGTPVERNLPEEIKLLREQHGQGLPNTETNTKKKTGRRLQKNASENIPDVNSDKDMCADVTSSEDKMNSVIIPSNDENIKTKDVAENEKLAVNGTELKSDNTAETVDHLKNANDLTKRLKTDNEALDEDTSKSKTLDTNSIDIGDTSGQVSENTQKEEPLPSFRVTCTRSGTEHVFGSAEGARQFGAAVNDRFNWKVDLTEFNMEIILNIVTNFVYVSIGLTKEPLFKRNLVAFGPTNLRATLCYSLVHLGRPKPGDVVLDHMCGGAGVPIEGCLSFPGTYHIGGDISSKAVCRARTNIDEISVNQKRSVFADVLNWDATRLPLRDSSVDVVVSDLPFGRRSGSRLDNRVLYLRALQETARVTRPTTGRAVLLTHDKNSMIKNLVTMKKFWRNSSTRTINIGGLYAGVFLLHRTCQVFSYITKDSLASTAANNTDNIQNER